MNFITLIEELRDELNNNVILKGHRIVQPNNIIMGKAKQMIDELIEKKAGGDKFQVSNVKMKLMFKGIMPDKITEDTPDDEEVISKIKEVAGQFNVTLSSN